MCHWLCWRVNDDMDLSTMVGSPDQYQKIPANVTRQQSKCIYNYPILYNSFLYKTIKFLDLEDNEIHTFVLKNDLETTIRCLNSKGTIKWDLDHLVESIRIKCVCQPVQTVVDFSTVPQSTLDAILIYLTRLLDHSHHNVTSMSREELFLTLLKIGGDILFSCSTVSIDQFNRDEINMYGLESV
jgi:hypothetical protein